MKKPKRKWWRWFIEWRNACWDWFGTASALRSLNKACDGVSDARTAVLLSRRSHAELVKLNNRLVDAERLIRACRAQLRGWNNPDNVEEAEDMRQRERVRLWEHEEEEG